MPRRRSAKRRVLIFSVSLGGGHRSAADSLCRQFRAQHGDGVEVRHIDLFEEFMPTFAVAARFAYQQPSGFFPAGMATFPELELSSPDNPVVNELRLRGLERAAAYCDEFDPDAILSTFPLAAAVAAEVRGSRDFFSAVVLTDLGLQNAWLHPGTNLYLVPTREMRDELVLRGVKYGSIVVSGIPVGERFGRAVDKGECRSALDCAERYTVCFVPEDDPRHLTSALLESGTQVIVAVEDERSRRRLDPVVSRGGALRVPERADKASMMCAADVVVCSAGGSTLAEALSLGRPAIVVPPVPGQEVHNIDFLLNSGALLLARDDEDVAEKVRFLSAHLDRLGEMTDNAMRVGSRAAAATVAQRVMAAIG